MLFLLFPILYLVDFSAGFKTANLRVYMNISTSDIFPKAAVVTNSDVCTTIAVDVLSEGGSAADAAIAALLCEGVTNPQSMGIGGGFLLTIYNKSSGAAEVLNARECAPEAAFKDMFGNPGKVDIASGGLSVAVPGEVRGYWALHKKYGRTSWYDLFRPTIDLCRNGIPVTRYTGKMINKVKDEINASPTLKEILMNPDTGDLFKEGELMFRGPLADTLEEIAKYGPKALYDGNLTDAFLDDLSDYGAIITKDDLKNYRAMWMKPIERTIFSHKFYTVPPPGSGSSLLLIVEMMSQLNCSPGDGGKFWHRLIETWKFAFGIRTETEAPSMGTILNYDFNEHHIQQILDKMSDRHTYPNAADYFGKYEMPEDHGTSHLCVLAPDGDAVSVTSTINLSFGALFRSESTGIILNNEMIDFSIPHHYAWRNNPTNYIRPKRQPMSSMVPTIITNPETKAVRLVIGSSGGFKILTSTTQVIIDHLINKKSLISAIKHKRLHHQLRPMLLEYEEGFNHNLLHILRHKGHHLLQLDDNFNVNSTASMAMHSSVNAIGVVNGEIHAVADQRRRAVAGGY